MMTKLLCKLIEFLDWWTEKEKSLAPPPPPSYNGPMDTPEFTADPMQPSPQLLRQIAQAIAEANTKGSAIPPDSMPAKWAQAFVKIYPNG
jgi:hypothetical protein